jgi:hypothetical protein
MMLEPVGKFFHVNQLEREKIPSILAKKVPLPAHYSPDFET